MAQISADRIAVSTWSLHRLLGTTYPHDLSTTEIGPMQETYGEGDESLLGLPSVLANHGYHRLEIVSFHLRSRDPVYLGELRDQLKIANVKLQTLLIDAGDISDPEHGARDQAWIASWIEIANELGAENARIIAGKQKPTRDALDRSVKALTALADGNAGSDVRLVTENWFDLLAEPAHVNFLLDKLDGRIGLLGDFGNWSGPEKYADLKSIFGRAELCHAKASFIDGDLDESDYGQCVALAEEAGYKGPYTLIFDSEIPNEWHGLGVERDFILSRDV
ncbi:sugar phosphate isomerase/epimerase [Devosia sp. J2-20]|jgi:sugar phosphate isomerase/epimerase|uniref:sugar phosphate isomerase/epimerase family protein n=1 Tax=Devosia sp. J2-20 TaxID=3026161 RepID=UPI00249A902E|nr:sugar phosphate isomerase/epimerase [Devosia sp. J2-20]WDR00676.1 sugar phosphate isomerase/epimerase [Devosia sp. J2-20]